MTVHSIIRWSDDNPATYSMLPADDVGDLLKDVFDNGGRTDAISVEILSFDDDDDAILPDLFDAVAAFKR